MNLLLLLSLMIVGSLNAQVCCSPVGNGQAGGGALMNNWSIQWPNSLVNDQRWHWVGDLQITERGPAGNIRYGPQTIALIEISRSLGLRNVGFITGVGGWGSIEEHVTFQNAQTFSYSGRISFGVRRALGNNGRTWLQFQTIIPGAPRYLNESFPFNSDESIKGEVLILHNQPMPWSVFYPDFLGTLSLSALYQKNFEKQDNINNDHLLLLHISAAIHTLYPVFLSPYTQIRAEQLLAPPSVWTIERETRILSTAIIGFDLAISRPYWDLLKLRVGIPFYAYSSSNGFPDGTQPAAYIKLAVNYSGIFGFAK